MHKKKMFICNGPHNLTTRRPHFGCEHTRSNCRNWQRSDTHTRTHAGTRNPASEHSAPPPNTQRTQTHTHTRTHTHTHTHAHTQPSVRAQRPSAKYATHTHTHTHIHIGNICEDGAHTCLHPIHEEKPTYYCTRIQGM